MVVRHVSAAESDLYVIISCNFLDTLYYAYELCWKALNTLTNTSCISACTASLWLIDVSVIIVLWYDWLQRHTCKEGGYFSATSQ